MKKSREISPNKWIMYLLSLVAVMLIGMGVLTYIVDPYFHFHAPLPGMSYRLYEQRYINDGISRHFAYDAVITGNSLSENIHTSHVDELFGSKSIKLPYSGAGFKEIWESLDRTLSYNDSVEKVFVIVDIEDMLREKDYRRYNDYPEYLYDDNPWNDAMYLWNKDVFYRGTLYNILMTIQGEESTSFDEYSVKNAETGERVVMSYVDEIPDAEEAHSWSYSTEENQMVRENIQQNIVRVVQKYPDVEFCLIYAPASVARWAKYYIWGDMYMRMEACKTATDILLEQENIHLYSFQDDFALVCDFDHYHDTLHYTVDVSKYMFEQIKAGKEEITKENCEEYFETISDFYYNYDYRTLQ